MKSVVKVLINKEFSRDHTHTNKERDKDTKRPKTVNMVDVISQNGIDEFEDGELPEDGEICDDEEEVAQSKPEPQQAQPSTSDTSAHRERERERERPRERGRTRRNDEQMDPFGPEQDAYSVNGGDKDYRSIEEDYSDIDYRVSRRRRHSPPNNNDHHHHHNHHHAKRPPIPYYNSRPASYRGGLHGAAAASRSSASSSASTSDATTIVPRFNTEKQICKFFREGYCRDGDDGCAYSHNTEDSLRRPILCNFYANSYCKKGLQCLMLHGEYPCREFHQNAGHCANEQCKYSHIPLTEYTRPLYEASLKEDHPMSRLHHRIAATPHVAAPLPTSRRKVLLPGGPPMIAAKMSPPMIHAAIPPSNGGQLAPPTVVVPTRSGGYPTTGYFNQGPQGLPPVRNIEPPKPVQQPVAAQPAPTPQPAFNIEAMLNKLAKGGDLSEDESPASPPPLPLFSQSPTLIAGGDTDTVPWRLIRVRREPAYTGVANCENIAANDPRKARCISAQFDAISSLLGGEATTSHVVEDPRLVATEKPAFSPVITSSWMPQMS